MARNLAQACSRSYNLWCRVFRTTRRSHGHQVYRLSPWTIIKISDVPDGLEAETMLYVAQNTTVPIPHIQDHWVEPVVMELRQPSYESFIVMDYVPGNTLETILKTLDSHRKTHIARQLRGYVQQLRSLTPPTHLAGRITAVNEGKRYDPLTSDYLFGPFESEASLNDFFLDRFSHMRKHESVRTWGDSFRKRLRDNHQIIFTHADLVRRNIIIGANDEVVSILDWGMAAFMPEQWEYLKTLRLDQYEDDGWMEFVSEFLDVYPEELDLHNEIREQYGWGVW